MADHYHVSEELKQCRKQLEHTLQDLQQARHIIAVLEEENYSLDFALLYLYLKEQQIETESYDASIFNSAEFQQWKGPKVRNGRFFKHVHKRIYQHGEF